MDMPKPHPFHITKLFQERGLWCFWLTADDDILARVNDLPCIIVPQFSGVPFGRRLTVRVMFAFNPRYCPNEAYNWLVQFLEVETNEVDLRDSWENAINKATNNK